MKRENFILKYLDWKKLKKPDSLKPNGGLWYRVADIQLHIGVEGEKNNSKRHPAFEVEDLNLVKKYLIEKGVKVKEEISIVGINRFSFYDPFGNRIELLEKI